MAVLTADHYIANQEQFKRVLSAAASLATEGHLVTLGITPSSPSTGFGYINQGKSLGNVDGFPAFYVERFTEKPNLETASQMIKSGTYSWNSGMFIWRVDRILAEFESQMPDFYAQMLKIEATLESPAYDELIKHLWPQSR